jgi:hypothetical protein
MKILNKLGLISSRKSVASLVDISGSFDVARYIGFAADFKV